MKTSFIAALFLILPLTAPSAWADDAHHPQKEKKGASMAEKDKPMQMGMMQENMLRMHEQMHKIMDSKTPEERAQLMQEHSKMMQDNMQMMQGMGGDSKGNKMDSGMKGMKGM